jgi:hypothetical protein
MRYVIVQDGKVVGSVFSPLGEPAKQKGLTFVEHELAQADWTYDAKKQEFTAPKPVEEQAPVQPPVVVRVPFLDFMERFTAEEKDAIVNSDDVETKLLLMHLAARSVDPSDKAVEKLLAKAGIKQARKKAILEAGKAA